MNVIGSVLEGYIPERELAHQVDRTPRTLRRWRKQPDGPPYVEMGNEIFYNIERWRAWFAARERRPNQRRSAA